MDNPAGTCHNPVKQFPFSHLKKLVCYFICLKNPSILAEQKLKPVVVIDEVQKLPEILDEVHRLIETRKLTFLLTGSSARKLKRGGCQFTGWKGLVG